MAHDACRPCRIAASPASSFEIRSSKGLETPGPCVTVLPRAGLDGPVSDGDGRRRRPHFNLVAPASFDLEASGRLLQIGRRTAGVVRRPRSPDNERRATGGARCSASSRSSRFWGGRGDASRAVGATTVAPFLDVGERCGQLRHHSEEVQRALSPRAAFQLVPIELSPRPSQHDRKRAQQRSIRARETEREGESCLRSEGHDRASAYLP